MVQLLALAAGHDSDILVFVFRKNRTCRIVVRIRPILGVSIVVRLLVGLISLVLRSITHVV